ncbi:hypothetical protein CAEBREN_15390 [Caenorhabditis brenneri]|uniref:Chromo domain-containing protein n=1 Tax=Caenorhabditis brenneri TaxID=135651 RepID=G0MSV2_CAEBE|nr:hypothetical protein CAEBREN_15390 [Caenorhabditis brenneri]
MQQMQQRSDLCVTCGKRKGECGMCEAQRQKCENYERDIVKKENDYDKLEDKYRKLKAKYKSLKRDRRYSSPDDDRDRSPERRIRELENEIDDLERKYQTQKGKARTAERRERELAERTEDMMNKAMRSKLQAYDEAANLYINLQHNPDRRRIEDAEEQIKNLMNKIMPELEKLRIENNELKQLIGSVQRNRAGPAPENQHSQQMHGEPIVYDVDDLESEASELNGDSDGRRLNELESDIDDEGDQMDDEDDVEPQASDLRRQIRKRPRQPDSDYEEDPIADEDNDADSVASELNQEDQEIESDREEVPMEDDGDEEKVYEVERVITARTVNGKKEYFVKWKNWPSSYNSWTTNIHYADE